MNVPNEKFDEWVGEAFDALPDDVTVHLHNVAILTEDYPTKEQLGKTKKEKNVTLLGLFEGYGQSKKINYGVVLPDRITLFRRPIMQLCSTEEEIKDQIMRTLRHEIAHHFGSDEKGATSASKIRK